MPSIVIPDLVQTFGPFVFPITSTQHASVFTVSHHSQVNEIEVFGIEADKETQLRCRAAAAFAEEVEQSKKVQKMEKVCCPG
jgi:hypothetical protein